MSAAPATALLADLARDPGPWTQVHLDVSVDTGDPVQVVETRAKSIRDRLERMDVPRDDVAAVAAALDADAPVPSPASHLVAVRRGELVLDEWMPGALPEGETVAYGPVLDLSPLLEREPPGFAFAVVETAREGGAVRLYHAGTATADSDETVQGRTDTLHAVKSGGWRQDLLQAHAREIWRQTQAELATAIDELVRREHPRVLVVSGEVDIRRTLVAELSEESRAITSTAPRDDPGSGALAEHVAAAVERARDAERSAALETVRMHGGRGDGLVATGVGEVVRALASAQADTVLLDRIALQDRTVLALDREPWIASAPEEALGAEQLASVSAIAGLARAAVLTDARVLFVGEATVPVGEDPRTLPEGAAAAALLRWPIGPAVPAA